MTSLLPRPLKSPATVLKAEETQERVLRGLACTGSKKTLFPPGWGFPELQRARRRAEPRRADGLPQAVRHACGRGGFWGACAGGAHGPTSQEAGAAEPHQFPDRPWSQSEWETPRNRLWVTTASDQRHRTVCVAPKLCEERGSDQVGAFRQLFLLMVTKTPPHRAQGKELTVVSEGTRRRVHARADRHKTLAFFLCAALQRAQASYSFL